MISDPHWLERVVEGYSKTNEELKFEFTISKISTHELHEMFSIPAEEPIVGCVEITKEISEKIKDKEEIEFDFENQDYFLATYATDLEQARSEGGLNGVIPSPKSFPSFPDLKPVKPKTEITQSGPRD